MESSKNVEYKPPGELFLDPNTALDKLQVLNSINIMIIQRKSTVDYFSGKVWYEIMDSQRNIIFKASKPKSLFRKSGGCKVSITNFKDVKVLTVLLESTTDFDKQTAGLYVNGDMKIGYVEKHGGIFGAPCFEIFNANGVTTFILETSTKKESNSATMEYEVRPTKGSPIVANIVMKTGLNYILNTDSRMPCLEKATLLGTILAMDLLKPKTNESSSCGNHYTMS